jgi:hypothetical protein
MLGTEPVRVRRRGGITADGDPTPATEWPVDDCLVDPGALGERLDIDRTAATTTVAVTMPITAGIDHTCELKIRGRWYRIVGDPEPFVNDEDPELSGYQVTATRGAG